MAYNNSAYKKKQRKELAKELWFTFIGMLIIAITYASGVILLWLAS